MEYQRFINSKYRISNYGYKNPIQLLNNHFSEIFHWSFEIFNGFNGRLGISYQFEKTKYRISNKLENELQKTWSFKISKINLYVGLIMDQGILRNLIFILRL